MFRFRPSHLTQNFSRHLGAKDMRTCYWTPDRPLKDGKIPVDPFLCMVLLSGLGGIILKMKYRIDRDALIDR